MNINKIDRHVLKMMDVAKVVRKVEIGPKQRKYMQESCYRFSEVTGRPLSEIQNLALGADMDHFTFLKTMINKFNYKKLHSMQDRAEHIFNIYSTVEKPSALHLNIVRKNNDSFEALEKIFNLAKDQESLQFVENLQYGELKNSDNASKIIVDLLSSKNRDKYISNTEKYSSYIESNADNKNAVKELDELIETGKFSKLRYDAKLAVKKLFMNKKVEIAMSGKTNDLENMYSKDRASFLKTLVNSFLPPKKVPQEETKLVLVNMYGTLDSSNAKLRNAIVDRFKRTPVNNRKAEIIEMQKLFNKIDTDNDAKIFVQKALSKDLKVSSIAELNEVVEATPLKKANVFFNNAKRIIETSEGEERKNALTVELENPFFEPKAPKKSKARMVRMFDDYTPKDNFFTRTVKIIENKINQYRYSRMCA